MISIKASDSNIFYYEFIVPYYKANNKNNLSIIKKQDNSIINNEYRLIRSQYAFIIQGPTVNWLLILEITFCFY